ncbi:MAG: MASE4 domain-containing protein [Candidatus Tectimicrobiota bacterium]
MERHTLEPGSSPGEPHREAVPVLTCWGQDADSQACGNTSDACPDERGLSLSTLPAGCRERQWALAVVLVSSAIFLAVAPFARLPLPPVWAFIPSYQAALVLNDLITAAFLFSQFSIVGSRALLTLASAYLFTACIAVAHTLIFPDLFAPTGLLGAGPQSTAWIYMFWHGGFPVLILLYTLLEGDTRPGGRLRGHTALAIAASALTVLVSVGGLTYLATAGQDALPPIMQGHRYTPSMRVVVSSVWSLSLLALLALWRRQPHTVLDVWLIVVMCAWLFDIALSAVLNGGRFDLGFYSGRLAGLLAASCVLLALLFEHGRLYARQAERMWLYSTTVESSADAITTETRGGLITGWNPAATHLYGFTAAEAVGQRSTLIVPPDRQDELAAMVAQLRCSERLASFETIRLHKDGRRLDIALTMSPVTTPEGVVLGISNIARDITAQKQMREQLRQAQKMEAIGQLTGGLAHDFNNMLGVIIGNLDLLEDCLADDASALKRIRNAPRAALRGADLTGRLLAFARRQPLHPEPTALNALLIALLAMLPHTLGPDVQITTQLAADLAPAHIDPAGLESALLNLALNARDAMPGGGTLTLMTASVHLDSSYGPVQAGEIVAGPYIWISVSDTGQGMSREILEQVFEPFFTTKARGKGTGMGLARVYDFVKQSHGNIRIYSEPGHGTAVHLYLPVAAAAAPPKPASTPAALFPQARGTVLVVDDEAELLDIAVTYLQELGFQTLQAPDGPTALNIAARVPALDLLLTDIVMPGSLHGVALAQELRHQQPDLRVIYASGFPASVLTERNQLYIDGPLVNIPYRKEQLVEAVRQVLARRHCPVLQTVIGHTRGEDTKGI